MHYCREEYGISQEFVWNPVAGEGNVAGQEGLVEMAIRTEHLSQCDRILQDAWANNRVVKLEWLRGTIGEWTVEHWQRRAGGPTVYGLLSAGPVAIVLRDEQGPTGWRQCEG